MLFVGEIVDAVVKSLKRLSDVVKIIARRTFNYKLNMVIDCRYITANFVKEKLFFLVADSRYYRNKVVGLSLIK